MPSDDTQHDSLTPPELRAPTDATVVNGQRATFVWDAVDDADRYRLQIAETAQFDELIVDEEVGNETAVTVGNQLPTDGDTVFWRVVPGTQSEWGAPSAVESFTAGTEEEAEQDFLAVSETGPVTGLARAAKREVTRRVFSFEDQFEKEKEKGVAYEGIAASQIIGIAGAILVVILTAIIVLFSWYGQVSQEARAGKSGPQNYRLYQEIEAEAEKTLGQYGVADEEKGAYRIPIEDAMDVVATEEYKRSQSTASSSEAPADTSTE